MPRHPSPLGRLAGAGALAIGALVAVSTVAARGVELSERLATGDAVGRFGRIGAAGFRVLGIDQSGRVLIGAGLSDGRLGLFFADGETLTPLWVAGGAPEQRPDPWFASLAPSGRVIATTDRGGRTQTVYEVTDGTRRRIAGPGDVDSGGRVLCQFSFPHINDAGVAAFVATALTDGADCGAVGSQTVPGIYTTAGGVLHRILAGTHHHSPSLLGVSATGEVIVGVRRESTTEIVAWSNGQMRHLVGDGDPGGASRRLFVFAPGDTQPRRVYPTATPLPRYGFPRLVDLTAAGAVLFEDGLRSFLLPPSGREPVELADRTTGLEPFAINDAGTVAAISYGAQGDSRGAVPLSGSQAGAASCAEPPPLATLTATAARTPTATATASPSASAPPTEACRGDCNGDGVVTIAEILSMVHCLLSPCLFFVEPGDACGGELNVVALVAAVNNALHGCSPVP